MNQKIIKYGINLDKEVKDLCTVNCKTLMKEIREHKQTERYAMLMD